MGDERLNGLEELLDYMLPGDTTRNLPLFSKLDIDLAVHFSGEDFETVDTLMKSHSCPTDVGSILKSLRAEAPSCAQKLTNAALDLYFTHPTVVTILQDGRATLFPHERFPKSLDYDLLEPVFEQQLGKLNDR